MKFMVTFTGHRSTHGASIEKFKKEGVKAPAGFEILGHWHGLGHGYMLIKCSDLAPVYAYAAQWSHLQDIEIEPVLDSEEAAKALGAYHIN